MQHINLDSYNLERAQRHLCIEALTAAGNIVGAAKLLGITRHSLKRRILKLDIAWTRQVGRVLDAEPVAVAATPAQMT